MRAYRAAQSCDIERFYGEMPNATMQAFVVLHDECPVCVMGLRLESDRAVFFSDHKPEVAADLKSIPYMRALKATQGMIRAQQLPVYSLSNNVSLLTRLGFRQIGGGLFRYEESQWPAH